MSNNSSMSGSVLSHATASGDYASSEAVYEAVRDYYGKVLSCTSDLKTSACCAVSGPSAVIQKVIKKIPQDILDRFYGCGTPLHTGIEGLDVLDLGSGSGRDCYIASALVGPSGSVTGIDMTQSQLQVSRSHVQQYCCQTPGYPKPNMRFLEGFMECLDQAGISEASVDLVISNCVLNLSPNKPEVLRQVHKVLRNGGEFFFSDVFCDRRLPENVRTNKLLLGECIGGALYTADFLHLCRKVGFADPRRVSIRPIPIDDPEIQQLVGAARFFSITYRLFKVDGLESECEDYGHMVTYKGTIPDAPLLYDLDEGHCFERGRPERVCGNTALMLGATWLKRHFDVTGSFETHFGAFPCGRPTLAGESYRGAMTQSSPSPSSSSCGSTSCCSGSGAGAAGASCCS